MARVFLQLTRFVSGAEFYIDVQDVVTIGTSAPSSPGGTRITTTNGTFADVREDPKVILAAMDRYCEAVHIVGAPGEDKNA